MAVIGSKLVIEAVDTITPFMGFECGVPTMDKFIREGLELSIKNHYCQAYAVKRDNDVIAMFALSFDSVDLDTDDKEEISAGISTTGIPDVDNDYEDTFYSKRRYPALDIAYFAVRKDMRGQHIGEFLISQIRKKAKEQRFAGCQFLSVEAYNVPGYSAVGFYDKCGFAPNELPDPNKDTLRMFMTLYSKPKDSI